MNSTIDYVNEDQKGPRMLGATYFLDKTNFGGIIDLGAVAADPRSKGAKDGWLTSQLWNKGIRTGVQTCALPIRWDQDGRHPRGGLISRPFQVARPDSSSGSRATGHLLADTRQILLPTSSATSRLPCWSITTPTGRPMAFSSLSRKPVSTSIGWPFGLPSAKGTKITL